MPVGAHDVDPAQAFHQASAGTVLLLDVREDDEWELGHAAGAEHLPLANVSTDSVAFDRPVVAICRSGRRSAVAAARLNDSGVTAHNMVGGMLAWAKEGLPIVTKDGNSGSVQ